MGFRLLCSALKIGSLSFRKERKLTVVVKKMGDALSDFF
jgi:hypothetical protein